LGGYCQVAEVSTNIGYLSAMMTTSKSLYRGYRFPAEVIQQAVWLYCVFHVMVGTVSSGWWAVIPRDCGHLRALSDKPK
jgi:hypothetical protein